MAYKLLVHTLPGTEKQLRGVFLFVCFKTFLPAPRKQKVLLLFFFSLYKEGNCTCLKTNCCDADEIAIQTISNRIPRESHNILA